MPRRTTPRPAANTSSTASAVRTGASSTTRGPSGNRAATRSATSVASRVFPAPPVPVSVTILRTCSSAAIASSASTRPTKLVSGTVRSGADATTGRGASVSRSDRASTSASMRPSSADGSSPSSSASRRLSAR